MYIKHIIIIFTGSCIDNESFEVRLKRSPMILSNISIIFRTNLKTIFYYFFRFRTDFECRTPKAFQILSKTRFSSNEKKLQICTIEGTVENVDL